MTDEPRRHDGRLGVGIVGAGNIAMRYIEDLVTYPDLRVVGVTDLAPERADRLARVAGCRVYPSLDELLAEDDVGLLVDLTPPSSHAAITRLGLEAGRHVFSEKPLALDTSDAHGLVELAHRRGLRLGCSPIVTMGELAQTAWSWVREGRLGTVRLAYADVNWGRVESWHPEPQAFHEVGALIDVGVYPMTLLTAIFGPARRVRAASAMLMPERSTLSGAPFRVERDDFVVALIELESGLLVRLTTDFYVSDRDRQRGIELHGDTGSLWLSNWFQYAGTLEHAPFGEDYRPVPLLREAKAAMPWGAGVVEMAASIREARPHRASGEQAAHVIETLNAVRHSADTGRAVAVGSSFSPPTPMAWAS